MITDVTVRCGGPMRLGCGRLFRVRLNDEIQFHALRCLHCGKKSVLDLRPQAEAEKRPPMLTHAPDMRAPWEEPFETQFVMAGNAADILDSQGAQAPPSAEEPVAELQPATAPNPAPTPEPVGVGAASAPEAVTPTVATHAPSPSVAERGGHQRASARKGAD